MLSCISYNRPNNTSIITHHYAYLFSIWLPKSGKAPRISSGFDSSGTICRKRSTKNETTSRELPSIAHDLKLFALRTSSADAFPELPIHDVSISDTSVRILCIPPSAAISHEFALETLFNTASLPSLPIPCNPSTPSVCITRCAASSA